MSFNKTLTTLAIALAIPFAAALPTSAQSLRYGSGQFSDTADHWAALCLEGMGAEGLIKGYLDGSFRPDATISRAEFAALVVNAFPNTPVVRTTPNFLDVPADYWAKESIDMGASQFCDEYNYSGNLTRSHPAA